MPALLTRTISVRDISPKTMMASLKIGGGHTVWCNPPYSQIKKWARKCYYEGHKPNTTVVLLAPSRTDTWWYQNYVLHRAEVRFIKGRLRFNGSTNNAPFPSALCIYRGPDEDPQMTWEDYKEVKSKWY